MFIRIPKILGVGYLLLSAIELGSCSYDKRGFTSEQVAEIKKVADVEAEKIILVRMRALNDRVDQMNERITKLEAVQFNRR